MKARKGYTLFETVLTLAVVTVAAGISWPLTRYLYGGTSMTAAADTVRARWADMKRLAMQEGRDYVFQVVSSTGRFRLQPAEQANGQTPTGASTLMEGELPPNMLFQLADGGASGDGYTTVLTIMADGTAQNDVSNLSLRDSKNGGPCFQVKLRRLTGIVTFERMPAASQ